MIYKLTLDPWSGGRGLSVSDVKGMTLYEILYHATDPSWVEGKKKMKPGEARELVGEVRHEGPVKKWADVNARERELYQKKWGKPMPEAFVGNPKVSRARPYSRKRSKPAAI